MHHPVQNGIVVTASDDRGIMFWRFKKSAGSDILKQEQLHYHLDKHKQHFNDVQSVVGEIDLLPVLKINASLEVKAIGMSTDGQILACTCYDEDEEPDNPELQLYFDANESWTFNNSCSKNVADGRLICRRITSLPFEPIPHCLCLSRNDKYVFVAMYSSWDILDDLNEEWTQKEHGGKENKYPNHPISLCCVNVQTGMTNECEKIWKYLKRDEHVSCMSISPNGERIAIGTSCGYLIVTGVSNLIGDDGATELWSSDMMNDDDDGDDADDSDDDDGSFLAIGWSPNSEWIVCGYASGKIQLWQKHKNGMRFKCVKSLDGIHVESINSLSIEGSLMATCGDDGDVVIHDMMNVFVDGTHKNSPITVGRVDKIYGGKMVHSVSLTPSTGHFVVTSGADSVVHCVSVLDICRETIRNYHSKKD